jgi:hypothetical protein
MLIETDNEQIKRRVYEMANCVRQNDVDGFLRYIDPAAPEVVARISREMPTYDFSICSVTGFQKVEIDPQDGSRAVARFNVFVNLSAPLINHTGPAVRGVQLNFRRSGDGPWKVDGFRHYPTESMQRVLDSR